MLSDAAGCMQEYYEVFTEDKGGPSVRTRLPSQRGVWELPVLSS
jgi:hypothetical protein